MTEKTHFTVIGAGHGGKAMAAHLAFMEFPTTLYNRYIFEDVPMSLVPIASLGAHYGVSVHRMDAMIRMACIIHKTDYWRRGRTLEKLGIGGLSVSELTQYVNEGAVEGMFS
jgi:opine dehydrogenase